MNSLIIGLAIVVGPIIGTLLINRQLNNQRKEALADKAEDRKREDEIRKADKERQDEVAAEAKRQQDEVAKEKKKQDELQSEQQKQVAAAVERAAVLLKESNVEALKGTDEVARLAAGEAPISNGVPVVISYLSTGQRETVFLSSVPRVGESIRLANGIERPSLIVVEVVWNEAALPPPHPSVIIVVRSVVGQDKAKSEAEAHKLGTEKKGGG